MKQRFPWLDPLLWLGGALWLAPLLLIGMISFATSDYRPSVQLWPTMWTGDNYRLAWQQGRFLLAFFNSALVAIAVTGSQLLTSLLAGYALARFPFRGRSLVNLLTIASLIIPMPLLVVPIFLILRSLHSINTYWALILPTAANGFGIFLLRQFIRGLPVELEQAAILDGARRWQVLWHIVLPLCRPALITLALFTFIGEWNDLFKPLMFTTRPELTTVQITLSSFQELYTANWSLLMAAVAIATLPVLVLFLIGQKSLLSGLTATGLKG
ncbi:MAG: carbohydrate ABC transporter permease [Oscillatoriales cyanobacterium SM2_2_1]|nr:carbohydrate ABC transporter permease [Oscillatoriales cyanobacterium SM2_2_1]